MTLYKPPEGDYRLEVYSLGSFVDGMESRIVELKARVYEPENLEWFDNLWENCGGVQEWFDLAHHIDPKMTLAQWEIAWQWRTILHPNGDQAIIEFVNALVGWY